MALTSGSIISASDFIALKAKVKEECNRRKYNGSVSKYGESGYDYSVVPEEGNVVLPEHVSKIIEPLRAINEDNVSAISTKSGDVIYALQQASDFVTRISNTSVYPLKASNTGCKASCTGLCKGTCSGDCQGCTGTCEGGCQGGCEDTCSSSCTGSCTGGCQTGCTGTCKGGCTGCSNQCTGCRGGCSGSCYTSCSSKCSNTCYDSCMNTEG